MYSEPGSFPTLSDPITAPTRAVAQFNVDLSHSAGGYSGHLYIYYDVLKGDQWVSERIEVPFSSSLTDTTYDLNWTQYQYQDLTQAPPSGRVVIQFTAGYLQTAVRYITTIRYPIENLVYKWMVLVVVQADQNLYRYFKTLQGYQDPLSIRLDQPTYSQIDGGVGLFGAYSSDSLIYVLPGNFDGNR